MTACRCAGSSRALRRWGLFSSLFTVNPPCHAPHVMSIMSCPCAVALAAAVPSGIRDAGVHAVDRFEALMRRCSFLEMSHINVPNFCVVILHHFCYDG